MKLRERIILATATIGCAAGIGFVMQHGPGDTRQAANAAPPATLKVTDVTLTSAPEMPGSPEMPAESALRDPAPVRIASATATAAPKLPDEEATPKMACDITLKAMPGTAAMVDLSLRAPCLPDERVTLHHNGMMVSEVTDKTGSLDVEFPALSKNAVFIASFGNGEGAVAQTKVDAVGSYDRVVVQWRGAGDLQIHALEFGADYYEMGHVWDGAAGDPEMAAKGEGGFITRLGNADVADPLLAEIYTFPSGITKRSGDVQLSVEAKVAKADCGDEVEAQTLEYTPGNPLKVQDVTLYMPDCDAVGDSLVLNNLLDDLTIAAK